MTTVTIQQNVGGYTGTIDTYLRESKPTTQYTAATQVYADGADSAGAEIQGLLSFASIFGDGPGQIPFGSTITSATLTLTGIDAVMAALQAAPDDVKGQMLPMIGMAQGMATAGPAGELVWEIDATTPGSVKINGMDMMGGQ